MRHPDEELPMRSPAALILLVALSVAVPALAQPAPTPVSPTAPATPVPAPPVARSGDQDTDFAKGMLALHERSIQVARTQMSRGRDAKLRKLARRIAVMQRREAAFLREWLAGKR
jgi:uncharacterized protein (DUF305 family)